MICLGIESSCDETAVALCADGRPLLEKLASQADLHVLNAPWSIGLTGGLGALGLALLSIPQTSGGSSARETE